MKKYYGMETMFYVGKTEEIKSTYKAIARAYRKGNTNLFPGFCEMPKFSERKICYAIQIEGNGSVMVLSSDTMTDLIVSGEALEWSEKKERKICEVNGYLRESASEWYALTENKLCRYLGHGKFQERDFEDLEELENFVYSEGKC